VKEISKERQHQLRCKRMDKYDSLPRETRDFAKEFGYNITIQFINSGVTNPKNMRHLLQTIIEDLGMGDEKTYSKQGQFDETQGQPIRCNSLAE